MTAPPKHLSSALEAEAAFYRAFEDADLEAMMAVWGNGPGIVCIHPAGPRLVGRARVRESWRRIFAGGPSMQFSIGERRVTETADLAVHVAQEIITVVGEAAPRRPIIATNAYQRSPGGWVMVLHHASPIALPTPAPAAPSSVH